MRKMIFIRSIVSLLAAFTWIVANAGAVELSDEKNRIAEVKKKVGSRGQDGQGYLRCGAHDKKRIKPAATSYGPTKLEPATESGFSWFPLENDPAVYMNLRRLIDGGQMPNTDALRVLD